MASQNEKIMIPVPKMGLREDVDRTVSDANMVVSGDNVVSVDGSMRPRPCHKLSSLNADQGLSWALSYDGSQTGNQVTGLSRLEFGSDEYLVACWLNPSTLAWDMIMSDDEGATWFVGKNSYEPATNFDIDAWAVIHKAAPTDEDIIYMAHVSNVSDEPTVYFGYNYEAWIADPENVTLNISPVFRWKSIAGSRVRAVRRFS